MDQELPKLDYCQNCGSPTPGNFCADCGQDSREHRVSLRLLLFGLWNDLFTFDSRFFRSFIPLLFKPGRLTREYISGRRVRYIPPVRLYLFVSILFFFLISMLFKGSVDTDDDEVSAMADSLATASAVVDSIPAAAGSDSLDMVTEVDDPLPDDGESDGYTNVTFFGRDTKVESDEISAIFLNLAPKGMFLLLPIFGGILALYYRRSRKLYIEHLIFSLHYHSFLYLLFIFTILFHKVFDWAPIWIIITVGFHIYLYLAMKTVYRQGWLKTWVKHFLLTSTYNFALMVVLIIMAIIGTSLALLAQDHPWLKNWFGG